MIIALPVIVAFLAGLAFLQGEWRTGTGITLGAAPLLVGVWLDWWLHRTR